VLFFYPAAMTAGCTAESCHFRDLGAEFSALGATRVGISHDDVATQLRFSEKHGFDYPLLSDPDGAVARRYGVHRALGPLPTRRWTFVIGADGRIAEVIKSETRMAIHADRAIVALRELAAR
jgi:peroxiredoxin Q/BCP